MKKRIKIAEIPIEIHTIYNSLKNTCAYETEDAAAFTVITTKEDIAAERIKSMNECAYEGIVYPDYSDAELENTAVYRKIAEKLPEYGAFVFHGSAVAKDGKAYLFTASSGTGKTTHTRLWLKNIKGSYVVNGDKPIIRIIEGKPFVCGTPWMGKEEYGCSENVPLHAVCLLYRGEENRIEKAKFRDVYPFLIGQCYRPENGTALVKTVKLLETVGKSTAVWELHCNMEDSAAETAYGGMCSGEIRK